MAMRKSRRGPRGAAERVEGLLVMLPWLISRKRVKLADMAKQFKLSEKELMNDLMMAAMCGVPPYTPDALIDVFVDEGEVVAEVPLMFSRPLQLNSAELFALQAMGSAALSMPGADKKGPLASALNKLKPLLPKGDAVVEVDVRAVKYLAEAQHAVSVGQFVAIDYFSPISGTHSTRTIFPRAVFEQMGHWYLRADDDQSGEIRNFRIDRIANFTPTGTTSDPLIEGIEAEVDFFGSDMETAMLLVRPAALRLVETYPFISREPLVDGSVKIEMAVGSQAWLGRLLLRGGDAIDVLAPTKWVNLGKDTARAVLKRYS
jgi:predicted DNA-binding transcriptional regulator YafY